MKCGKEKLLTVKLTLHRTTKCNNLGNTLCKDFTYIFKLLYM